MDNLNDITDDLLTLPGFVRRNLLLIRDLDLKSSSLFNEANKLSQSVFGTEFDTDHKTNSSFDKLSTASAPSSTVSLASGTKLDSVSSRRDEVSSSKKEESPESKSKSTKSKHDSDRSEKSDRHLSSKLVSNKRRSSRDSMSSDDCEHLFFEHTKQFDEIQNLRMQGIYVLQEKIDVNSQITSMLKYEYENLKSKFDSLYAEMDLKGQIPHELKMYIASNKKRLHPLGSLQENELESSDKKTEERSIGQNQLDISTMFRNVINNQNNLKAKEDKEGSDQQTEGKEGYSEQGSKLVNRHVPENQTS